MDQIIFEEIFDNVAALVISEAFPFSQFCLVGVPKTDMPNVLILFLVVVLSYFNT